MSSAVTSSDMFRGQSVRLAVKVVNWKPTELEWKHAAQCIKPEEKERIGQFYFKRDAKSAMAGRLLMRYAVSQMLDEPTNLLLFDRSKNGKPTLLSSEDRLTVRGDISFNVSHQGDYVVLAADRGKKNIGVDVMKVEWPRNTPISTFFKTMERQYTENEWSEVKRKEDEMEQLKVFFRIWTLKEAVVKALGLGIGFGVDRLNFVFKTRDIADSQVCCDTTVEIDDDPALEWKFEETFIDDHCMAVGFITDGPQQQTKLPPDGETQSISKFHTVDMEQVLSGCLPIVDNEPDQAYWELFNSRDEAPKLKS